MKEGLNSGLMNAITLTKNGHTEIMKKIVVLLLAGLIFAVNAHAQDNALAPKSVHCTSKQR